MRRPLDRHTGHVARWLEASGESLVADGAQARAFLRLLDPGAAWFWFRTFSDTPYTREPGGDPLERAIRSSLDDCLAELTRLNRAGAAVSVTVNEARAAGRRPSDVTRVRALFVDDDRVRSAVPTFPVPPHLSVATSPGRYHHYWLVRDLDLDEFVPLQRRLAHACGTDTRVCALNQSMGLPGFWRRKKASVPVEARLWRVAREPVPLDREQVLRLLDRGSPADGAG
jgi:hypothetical protein